MENLELMFAAASITSNVSDSENEDESCAAQQTEQVHMAMPSRLIK